MQSSSSISIWASCKVTLKLKGIFALTGSENHPLNSVISPLSGEPAVSLHVLLWAGAYLATARSFQTQIEWLDDLMFLKLRHHSHKPNDLTAVAETLPICGNVSW